MARYLFILIIIYLIIKAKCPILIITIFNFCFRKIN